MNFKGSALLSILLTSLNTVFSQNVASVTEKKLRWVDDPKIEFFYTHEFSISNSLFNNLTLPAISEMIETSTRAKIEFTELNYESYTPSNKTLSQKLSNLKGQPAPVIYHTLEGNKIYTAYSICPFKEQNGQYYRLKSFKYQITEGTPFAQPGTSASTSKRAAANSVLASGTWLKFSVTQDGLYKLTASDLQQAGINVGSLDPKRIKMYSHQGGMLSELNSAPSFEDIPEMAIQVVGENDGVFDAGDFILFYAESPHKWKFSPSENRFIHETNIYSDKTYIFLTIEGALGKRMNTKSDGQSLSPDASFNWFDYHFVHEQELENICHQGRVFLGEKFDSKLIYNFTHALPNVTSNKNVKVYFEAASVSPVQSSILLKMNNVNAATFEMSSFNDPESCYSNGVAGITRALGEIGSVSSLNLSFIYNQPVSSSKAWLNFFEIHCSRALKMSESNMRFRNVLSANYNTVEYRITDMPLNGVLLDVTDPVFPMVQSTFSDNSEKVFRSSSSGLIRQYLLCDGNFLSPTFEGTVANQNLHATGIVQFIIVSHPDFLEAANKLADWHRTRDNMSVKVVTPQQIYNEFSSGSQDIVAIRDYFKHVYYSNTNPVNQLKYGLLFGDASFDYKDRISNNTNFIPVYESDPYLKVPFNGAEYYCSDDFFGFLDSTDGKWVNNQKLEIAVSRLPVASSEEAMKMVDKILNYKLPQSLGDWRSFVTFCADDADAGWETEFVTDFETMYEIVDTTFRNVNVRKVYIDAFKQLNLGGSQRYPDAQLAVKKEFEQGTLIFNYVGHGGEEYLATEKVIDIPLINGLNNLNSLPAFFTATCEFSRYDDAKHKSAGEYVITHPNGGAIAMFTTTRQVGSFANYLLTREFWDNCVYTKVGNKWPTLGDVYKKLKNWSGQGFNDRKFTLFADPALVLNYPEYVVKVDSMNSAFISPGKDTIKALSKITYKGHLEDIFGNRLNTFNGTLFPTVYDKPSQFKTLNNDNVPGAELPFNLYSSILYKGQSSVNNGDWTFTFVVPKDINYTYGYGRLSLYAENGKEDAWGNYREFYVGGASLTAATDVVGPEIELFVDDFNFVSGGLTDNTPLLLARVYDENGINTSGIGIGRDIVAIIDKGTANEKRFVLNAFYSAKLNSYTTGDIRYQLEGIADGVHTYTLKVWDVYNNSSEATIEFVVRNNEDLKLEHVLNYPNPFSTNTEFHFDHNQAGQNLKVIITIMTVTGKVMKTIEEDVPNAPGHVSQITWNGRDEYDDKPSKGVYIYKITVITEDGKKAEIIEKLVILN